MYFNNLFVFGRPGGGKSEFIDFMKKCEPKKRLRKFHIAPFDIIDDFPFIWEFAENEAILEELSIPRRFTETTNDGVVVTDGVFFDFVSKKINRMYSKDYLSNGGFHKEKALLIEFSRSDKEAGYRRSLSLLGSEILGQGAIIYIKVSYEEALRRNEARYQEKLKYSVLAHKVPERAMERFYRRDDWEEMTKGESDGFIDINGVKIPFVMMDNELENKDLDVMEGKYASSLDTLYDLWVHSSHSFLRGGE